MPSPCLGCPDHPCLVPCGPWQEWIGEGAGLNVLRPEPEDPTKMDGVF